MTNLKKNLFAAVLLATSTMAVSAQPHTSAVSASAAASSSIDKTRAEVRADLALWKKAGLVIDPFPPLFQGGQIHG